MTRVQPHDFQTEKVRQTRINAGFGALFVLFKDYKKDIFGRFAYDFELSQNILSFLI